jgi:hypothetical protein
MQAELQAAMNVERAIPLEGFANAAVEEWLRQRRLFKPHHNTSSKHGSGCTSNDGS